MEIWRDIQGYEGLYQVSNEGRVKSLDRVVMRKNGIPLTVKGRFLKPYINPLDGRHMVVALCKNNIPKTHKIHQLVAQAFIPNPNCCTVVHHKDHNPENNVVENLEWMSKLEHQSLHGNEMAETFRENYSKTVYQYTLDGELVGIWLSTINAATELGYNQGAIAACCRNEYKRDGNNVYKGFKWSYERLQNTSGTAS